MFFLLIWATRRRVVTQERHQLSKQAALFYCAFIQLSDPVTLTDRSEMEIRRGAPSAVPR
jgi:hypothetical protein